MKDVALNECSHYLYILIGGLFCDPRRKWMKSHLAQHARVVKNDVSFARHHHSSVVDARRGLYASAVSVRGRCAPIHVQKVTTGPNAGIICEVTVVA